MFHNADSNRYQSRWRLGKGAKICLLFFTLLLLFSSLGFMGIRYYYQWRAQGYDLAFVAAQADESMLYDSRNQLIGSLSNEGHGQIQYADLPQHFIDALLAREDEHFFEHDGIVYLALLRSTYRNMKSMRYAQGASTITMQLARNVFEVRERTIDRKLLEITLAQNIEKRYSKEDILTHYLNRIYFGENCYGIAHASAHYFSKDVADLNLVESACLVGLVRGPSIFNPVKSMEKALKVKNETLERMWEAGKLSQEEFDKAKAAPIELRLSNQGEEAGSYPLLAVHQELEQLDFEVDEQTASIAVVSQINLDIQRYMESMTESCLNWIEGTEPIPEHWAAMLEKEEEAQEALLKRWAKMKRPEVMPTRMQDGLAKSLQCVVLVLDSRLNSKGDVLAFAAGRCAIDHIDRWQKIIMPGAAIAPLCFSAALDPYLEHSIPIVASNVEETARKIGYEHLSDFYRMTGLFDTIPSAEKANLLFSGQLPITLQNLARCHYAILHNGLDYSWNRVQAIYSQNRYSLYQHKAQNPPEIVRREAARIVSQLSPFQYQESKETYLNVALPAGMGQWCVATNERGVTVFVWVGFDEVNSERMADPLLQKFLAEFPLILAKDIHKTSRKILSTKKN